MANFNTLEALVATLVERVAKMEVTAANAAVAIRGFADVLKVEIEKAVLADNDIDNSKIAMLHGVVDNVTAKVTASESDLAAALVTPPTEPPAEPAPV